MMGTKTARKKKSFARAAHVFSKFLCLCFVRLQKLPSYTFYGGNALRVPVHFFVTAAHVHLGGR